MNQHYRAFGSLFFLLHQGKLLWLLNAPIIGRWFRRVLRISGESSSVGRRRIFRILPHAIFWGDGLRQKAEFRTHAKFSKRLYYAFRPLWWTLHAWDWAFADRWVPQLSFGFSTLTKYPNADGDGGQNTVDGTVARWSVDETWANIRTGAGNSPVSNVASSYPIRITASATTNKYAQLWRSIFLFDTSALTAGATISAAVLSLFGVNKTDGNVIAPDIDIYTSTPASNTALANGDYAQIGSTSQTGAPITYGNWSIVAYNDFTFDATGRGNVSKTGISKFGARNANYDVAGTNPSGVGWVSAANSRMGSYFADQTGTANDPKLVVTYLIQITPTVGSLSSSGVASLNDLGIFTPTEVNIQ